MVLYCVNEISAFVTFPFCDNGRVAMGISRQNKMMMSKVLVGCANAVLSLS